MKKKLKKIFNVIIDIVVILILLISVVVVVMSLTTNSWGVPNIFGYAPLSVQSESMSPTFDTGDLIISKIVTDPESEVKVGDVITFPISVNGVTVLNTHRVVEIFQDDNITYYKTQGDNENTNPQPDEEMQSNETIRAVWTGGRIPKVGSFLSFIRTQLGFFLCVLLPMIIFFVYEMIRVIINVLNYNKEKAAEAAQKVIEDSELTEEQKQRAIAEYLAQQNKQKEDSQTVQTPAESENSESDSKS